MTLRTYSRFNPSAISDNLELLEAGRVTTPALFDAAQLGTSLALERGDTVLM